MELLGKTLYTQDEVIKQINNRLGAKTLEPRMFSYLKDVRDIIPKPIRIKTKEGRSGANSYYTEETLEYLTGIMREYSDSAKTLKDIQENISTEIERHIIESDIFRYKCEVYLKFKKAIESSTKELSQAFGNVSLEFKKTSVPEFLNKGLKDTLKQALKAIEAGAGDDKLDSLFERLLFVYNQRLKHRMKEKVLEERERR
ncbi:MAG: hypothetical protein NTZ95_01075 [Candidatus Omnitrophica bacterium]|nr:hypothetical protein [Candidatus Omnitrophota bacterium]